MHYSHLQHSPLKIFLIDYGSGNLRSVQKAIETIGFAATISCDPHMLAQADVLVLPGQGAVKDAMRHLKEKNLDILIKKHIAQKKAFLGICLGMQLLFTRSEEDNGHACLGVFEGEVKKFTTPKLKVPHMGWNQLNVIQNPYGYLTGIAPHSEKLAYAYFAHSYYVETPLQNILGTTTTYGPTFVLTVQTAHVLGIQFHPEKSGETGLMLLRNFLLTQHSQQSTFI